MATSLSTEPARCLCLEAKGEPVLLQSLGTPDMTLLSTPQAFE
ncbi:hypothetical protein PC117_g11562, partial [Phytophthora cactorum]